MLSEQTHVPRSPGWKTGGQGVENGWRWLWRRRRDGSLSRSSSELESARTPKMARLEAALFVADTALSLKKLTQIATLESVKEARELVSQLNMLYDAEQSAFRIEHVATGIRLLTRPQLSTWLDRLHSRQASLKLSPPAMETLAIIAYKQPCTRADVDAVRGVQSAEMIKQLLERNLIRVSGEDDSLGRPYLYSTTRTFLESFGVTNLDDLPMAETLRVTHKEFDEPVESHDEAAEEVATPDVSSEQAA